MKYKTFGRTGLIVSEVSLGAMTFGGLGGAGTTDDKESEKVFNRFIEAGGNYIDTANVYSGGLSEELVGKFAKGKRDELVIGTKYTFPTSPTPANPEYNGVRFYGNSRKRIEIEVNASLKRLSTDYIDIYWVHVYDQFTPIEEIMESMNNLINAGKIRYFGVSNMPAWLIAIGNTFAKYNSMDGFTGIQVEYNLARRSIEQELIPMANSLGMSINAWSPLAGGLLTGKYINNGADAGRLGKFDPVGYMKDEHNIEVAKAVVEVAKEIGRTPAEVAINWVQYSNPNMITILGAKNVEQLNTNLSAIEFELPKEAREKLDNASATADSYPNDFIRRVNSRLTGGNTSKVYRMTEGSIILY